jgi:hypothetical protein
MRGKMMARKNRMRSCLQCVGWPRILRMQIHLFCAIISLGVMPKRFLKALRHVVGLV